MQLSIDGIVISNTTVQRPPDLLEKKVAEEKGGLSGPPLNKISNALIQKVYKMTDGR
jgi:dihydroorotate dehydrogenase